MSFFPSDILLRQVPAALKAGFKSGDYRIYGSIIRSTSKRRIVGHLQETSALTSLLAKGPFAFGDLAAQGVILIQNEQIKSAIETVRSLQAAGLALSAVSIGVSVAGTAILAHRIGQVEQKVDALIPRLEELARGIEVLRRERIAEDFTRLRTLADQIDECWLLEYAQPEWRSLAREAHFLSSSFARRAGELIEQGGVDFLNSEPFTDAFALAASLRVTARLAAGDDEAARAAASERADCLVDLGRPLKLPSLVLQTMRNFVDCAGSPAWNERLEQTVADFQPSLEIARHREVDAAATVLTLEALAEQGISGRDWLAAARSEITSPLLFLRSGLLNEI